MNSIQIDVSSLIIGIVLALFTQCLGQWYGNKKERNLLKIRKGKLKNEFINKRQKLICVLDKHHLYASICKEIGSEEDYNDTARDVFSKVASLSNFWYEHHTYNHITGEHDDDSDYIETPQMEIDYINNELSSDSLGEYEYNDLKGRLEYLEKLNIHSEIACISEMINQFVEVYPNIYSEEFAFVQSKIKKYFINKNKYYAKLCHVLLDQQNLFTKIYFRYMECANIERNIINSTKRTDIEFVLWFSEDNDLIKETKPNQFIELEKHYEEHKRIKVRLNNADIIKQTIQNLNDTIGKTLIIHHKILKLRK